MFNILKNIRKLNSNRIFNKIDNKYSKNIFKMNFSNNKTIKVTENKLFLKKDEEIKNNTDELMMRASMII